MILRSCCQLTEQDGGSGSGALWITINTAKAENTTIMEDEEALNEIIR